MTNNKVQKTNSGVAYTVEYDNGWWMLSTNKVVRAMSGNLSWIVNTIPMLEAQAAREKCR